jgi:hypothetical protein
VIVGVAAVVALLLTVLVARATGLLAGDDDKEAAAPASGTPTAPASSKPTDGAGQQSSDQPAPSAEASQAAVSPALRRCAADVSRAEKVVAAAGDGVSSWNSHVQARTDMLNGRMSVSEMDDMWERTRLAGPVGQQRFRDALDSYDAKSSCDDLRSSSQAGQASAGCVARFDTAAKAVDAAEAAMKDWKSHLDNMAAYAAGEMTRDEAQTRWVRAWRDAPVHIKAYEKAREALSDAPPCDAEAG